MKFFCEFRLPVLTQAVELIRIALLLTDWISKLTLPAVVPHVRKIEQWPQLRSDFSY
jgi:hypothetical protein